MSATTNTKIEQSLSSSATPEPYSFRLPATGKTDPYFGANRTFWNDRVLPSRNNQKPPVKSVQVGMPGSKRKVRFILFQSAKRYFDALVNGTANDAESR